MDPLSRQEMVALRIGIVFLFLSIVVSTAIERSTDDVFMAGISQGILVVGWVALWRPAERFIVEIVPHFFNKRRITVRRYRRALRLDLAVHSGQWLHASTLFPSGSSTYAP